MYAARGDARKGGADESRALCTKLRTVAEWR